MSDKLRIVIDMDDVMADTGVSIIDLYNAEFGTTYVKQDFLGKLKWEDLAENYAKVRPKLWEPGFFRNVKVMEGAIETVKALHDKHEVFVVSAAMEFPNSLKEKHDWLNEFFPFIHWRNMVLCGDKSIVNGDVMIDDHVKNLEVFKGRTLMYDAMHNQDVTDFQRVKSWAEIAQILL